MAATPESSNFFASSITARSLFCAHPSVATKPSFASIPTIILLGNSLQDSLTNSGFLTAAVPRITLSMPESSQVSIV